ncbi:MAG: alpha/beta fold hydrolase [Sporomusaceae bacterium]|nr:alpha/beta fold hydrolase [Sporomusaceae bacterium]
MAIMEGAEPFFLPGGDRGIILIHGFTGSPAEVRLLGEFLHKKGYTVLAPRLCGHGTTVEEMANTKWPHWYSAVEDAYHIIKTQCTSIAVIGLSMGGLLAFKLAAEYQVNKIVSLSTPIFIADKRVEMLPMYRMFRTFVPKKRKAYADIGPQYSVGYSATPLSSLSSLLDLIQHTDMLLPVINTPLLIIQSHRDHTVEPRSAEYIYDKAASKEKTLLWLEKSGHLVTIDIEREHVFQKITEFL